MCVYLCVVTAYKSLQSRDQVRGAAWTKDGWNQCVAKTGVILDHYIDGILTF